MSEEATLYEAMYILDATLEEQQQQEAIAAVEAAIVENGAAVENTLEYGRRRLAYEINGHTEGLYMITYFRGEGDIVRTLTNEFRMIEAIVRGMVVVANPDALFKGTAQAVEAAEVPVEEAATGVEVAEEQTSDAEAVSDEEPAAAVAEQVLEETATEEPEADEPSAEESGETTEDDEAAEDEETAE